VHGDDCVCDYTNSSVHEFGSPTSLILSTTAQTAMIERVGCRQIPRNTCNLRRQVATGRPCPTCQRSTKTVEFSLDPSTDTDPSVFFFVAETLQAKTSGSILTDTKVN
jgi:hypothetical protein